MSWAFTPVRVSGGETLLRQGEEADGMYVVLTGRLRVFVEEAGQEDRMVGEVGRGECVGEMGVLIGGPRSATVCAVRDSELVRLSPEAQPCRTRSRRQPPARSVAMVRD